MFFIHNQEELNNLDISSIQNVDAIEMFNINYIPEGKFYGLKNLKSIFMGEVREIKSGAFMNCENLNYIYINNMKEIGDFAFHNTKINFIPELHENVKFGAYNNLGKNINLNNLSWKDIGKISKLNLAEKYFKIGDTKSIIYNDEEVYNVQIIGFNHDDLANKNNKTSITFQFKECITTTCMNLRSTNVGGWEVSEMRRYLNEDIYELLSVDLQAEIKEVSKASYVRNKNTTKKVTTTDKLFLLSLEETGLSDPYNLINQGEKYKFYSDNISRIKFYLNGLAANWWLRSANTNAINTFFSVYYDGSYSYDDANSPYGVAPAFCI